MREILGDWAVEADLVDRGKFELLLTSSSAQGFDLVQEPIGFCCKYGFELGPRDRKRGRTDIEAKARVAEKSCFERDGANASKGIENASTGLLE